MIYELLASFADMFVWKIHPVVHCVPLFICSRMTVPTPTPILANNANIVATLNQPTGLIRPTEAPPKRNQVKNACSKYSFLSLFTLFLVMMYTFVYMKKFSLELYDDDI